MGKELPAEGHRTVARVLRDLATEKVDPKERQAIMLRAIRHEAMAEELDQLEAGDDPVGGIA